MKLTVTNHATLQTVKNARVSIVYAIKVLVIRELPLIPVRLRRRMIYIVVEMKRSHKRPEAIAMLANTCHQLNFKINYNKCKTIESYFACSRERKICTRKLRKRLKREVKTI